MRRTLIAMGIAAAAAVSASEASRKLVAVAAPGHDPLFVDMATVERRGAVVAFKYVLDVRVESESKNEWRSNEIEATIDCAQKTYSIRRVVAYPGPRASGAATGVHSLMAPAPKPEKISARSTFAYLEDHLCRSSATSG